MLKLQHAIQHLNRQLEVQMHKEDAILFPAIADLEKVVVPGGRPSGLVFGSVANPTRAMGEENNRAADATHEKSVVRNNVTCTGSA